MPAIVDDECPNSSAAPSDLEAAGIRPSAYESPQSRGGTIADNARWELMLRRIQTASGLIAATVATGTLPAAPQLTNPCSYLATADASTLPGAPATPGAICVGGHVLTLDKAAEALARRDGLYAALYGCVEAVVVSSFLPVDVTACCDPADNREYLKLRVATSGATLSEAHDILYGAIERRVISSERVRFVFVMV